MGEKEQGAERQGSLPSESERKAGETKGKELEREGGATHEDDWEAPASLATGDLDGDGMPDAAQKVVTKTSSNIQNNREAGSGGPGGAQAVQYNESELEFRKAGDAGGTGAAEAGPIRLDPTPARLSQGGGDDIAIGDPGVNGN